MLQPLQAIGFQQIMSRTLSSSRLNPTDKESKGVQGRTTGSTGGALTEI